MAKYLLRLDDAAHHMNLDNWTIILNLCDKYNLKPVIAVIPDVKDLDLLQYQKVDNLWDIIRMWQNKGYTIGLHGFNHKYDSTRCGLINPRPKSEFSGLNESEQKIKVLSGLNIFKREKILTNLFIAPGHSFDLVTIKVLIDCGVEYIYDGFFRDPVQYLGIKWIPQQLWKGKKMPKGTWTICLHPNTMKSRDITELEMFISKNHKKFIKFSETKVPISMLSRFFNLSRNLFIVKKNFIKYHIKAYFLNRR
jgi:predicted deacetylase